MQSITIEVKRWNVRPTAYLLRHYSSWDTEALRCWVLEAATEENGEWTVLSEHKDDTHLKEKGAWHIWPLSDVSPPHTHPQTPGRLRLIGCWLLPLLQNHAARSELEQPRLPRMQRL